MKRFSIGLAHSLWIAVLTVLAGLAVQGAASAQQMPSQSQIDMFRNLPPDQQQAILQALGIGSSDGVQRDNNLSTGSGAQTQGNQNRVPGLGQGIGTPGANAGLAPTEPHIGPSDTILLGVEIRTTMPAPGAAAQPQVLGQVAPGQTAPGQPAPVQAAPPVVPQVQIDRTPEELQRLTDMRDRLLKGNPYKLDATGVLRASGLAPILLSGLTADQATDRLNSDPLLRDFEVKVTLLPLDKVGEEALKPFGYDLFANPASTFAPVSDVPVPSEYVVGPGDRLEVQLIGSTKGRYSLVVNRDGRIMFPELGPIAVSGMRFPDAKAQIERRVSEQMIGTQCIVSMGDLRTIRVFVMGEAVQPGSYTVGGLSTISNALFASGGITPIGSLRNIQIKRQGAVVQRLDLYDLLLNGDTSGDVRVLPGDVIFIPPVGAQVGITGQIRRPAIYEIKAGGTVADLLYLAGGLLPDADPKMAKLERIDDSRHRVVLDINLSDPESRMTRLKSGDLLRIGEVRPTYTNAIHVDGHVQRPTTFQYRSGLRLTDVLPSADDLLPNSDLHYVLVRRVNPATGQISGVSADLEAAWRAPGGPADIKLAPRDRVYVFDLEAGRNQILDPIVDQIKLQGTAAKPSQIVSVAGRVRAPGEYPLEPGMRVSDLVRAGGGLVDDAYGGVAELARYEVHNGETRQTDVMQVDLSRALAGDPAANVPLGPFDFLVIKEVSQWGDQETVRLEGEVRFPGDYPIEQGETLGHLLARAGGLTPLAFPEGAVFTRDSLKQREKEQIKVLVQRMRQDLGTLALQSSQGQGAAASQAAQQLQIGQSLLNDLSNAEPVGRLVIDLKRVMTAKPNSPEDLILRGGDRLKVPRRSQEVTVLGEVQNATSHVYEPKLSRDDYIKLSGGATQKADEKRIYVVRANGSVAANEGSAWFGGGSSGIQPGDTIVVPLDAERMRPLPLWTAVTTILYNIAVSVAAVGSL